MLGVGFVWEVVCRLLLRGCGVGLLVMGLLVKVRLGGCWWRVGRGVERGGMGDGGNGEDGGDMGENGEDGENREHRKNGRE